MKGIICINKPYGCTSFDVIAKLRRILEEKKIGHSGTLDPIATGVLPVFIGKATKAISFLQDTDKEYEVGFKLGVDTDTFDITGKIIKQTNSNINRLKFEDILKQFKGEISQIPPKYSAIKINGIPAYKLARAGQSVDVKARYVHIFKIECLNFDERAQEGKFTVYCSSGTYVRSICNDIGSRLGVGCVMTSLIRTKASRWGLDDCYTIEEIKELKEKESLSSVIVKLEDIFTGLAKVKLNLAGKLKFMNGAAIKLSNKINANKLVKVFYYDEFLGLARVVDNRLCVEKLLI